MNPEETLATYCRRYGVPEEFGRRLLPLLERAAQAAPDVRQRILELVEQSFEKEATRRAAHRTPGADTEERVLRTVANVLHGWQPPAWVLRWGKPGEGRSGGDASDAPQG